MTQEFQRKVLATPASVGVLRDLTEALLRKWGLDDRIDDAALIVSELATNAVRTVRGTVIQLTISMARSAPAIVFEMWDQSTERPMPRQAGPDDETGRGLSIVTALASDWGVRHHPEGGKTVWAALAVEAR